MMKMNIGELANSILERVKTATISYQPSRETLESNKTKVIIGAASLGALYIIPGDQTLLSTIATCYTALKSYHSIRDWAGK